MSKEPETEIEGVIVGQERGKFIVETALGLVECNFGKMRGKSVRLTVGDSVICIPSNYDITKGRIIRRL